MKYKEMALLVVKHLENIKAEGWVIAQALDKHHLEKTYELIKRTQTLSKMNWWRN